MTHKLLLADDSVTIQRVIELTFADEDVRVVAVGDGKQAIDSLQTERPDIVLADVGMPERDGYEVAAFVKGHPDFAHVPVLLLTGAFEPIDEQRARAAGCDGVLVKPFEPQMVINRVKDLLAGRRPTELWAAVPAAQPSKTPVTGDVDFHSARPTQEGKGSGGSEDYFDRLDAAFAKLDSSAPAAGGDPMAAKLAPASSALAPAAPERMSLGSHDTLAGSDPELSGHPTRSSAASSIFDIEPSRTLPPAPATAPGSSPQALPHGSSLAEAFAALLAAEQGQSIAPASIRPEDIPDDTIEAIVRRVIDRMGTQTVQQAVLDVAERMVGEEIARIKRGSS